MIGGRLGTREQYVSVVELNELPPSQYISVSTAPWAVIAFLMSCIAAGWYVLSGSIHCWEVTQHCGA